MDRPIRHFLSALFVIEVAHEVSPMKCGVKKNVGGVVNCDAKKWKVKGATNALKLILNIMKMHSKSIFRFILAKYI